MGRRRDAIASIGGSAARSTRERRTASEVALERRKYCRSDSQDQPWGPMYLDARLLAPFAYAAPE